MLSAHDRAYYENRVEAELDMAQRSADPCAVKSHYDLANLYLAILYDSGGERPALAALDDQFASNSLADVRKPVICS